jgi:ATP-dependent Clp protease adaptor protein ClpS
MPDIDPANKMDTLSEPQIVREAKSDRRQKTKRQPPYAVILHNDPINGFDYVVGVLRKIFGYGVTRSSWLTLQAHVSGQTVIWTGSFEVAEFKRDQVRSCGPDPAMIDKGAGQLTVSLEPLPQ